MVGVTVRAIGESCEIGGLSVSFQICFGASERSLNADLKKVGTVRAGRYMYRFGC
jgi:hypothetical protein